MMSLLGITTDLEIYPTKLVHLLTSPLGCKSSVTSELFGFRTDSDTVQV